MSDGTGGIVLAGGRSSRFGRDKLLEVIDGVPMLDRAVLAVQAVASQVVVVTAPDVDRSVPQGVLIVRDPAPFEGPLVGLATGLTALAQDIDRVIVVGGDMPFMVPAVLGALVELLDDDTSGAIMEARGLRASLPMALDRRAATSAVGAILGTGERRLGWLRNELSFRLLDERVWRSLDPSGATRRDIDMPFDLAPPTQLPRR